MQLELLSVLLPALFPPVLVTINWGELIVVFVFQLVYEDLAGYCLRYTRTVLVPQQSRWATRIQALEIGWPVTSPGFTAFKLGGPGPSFVTWKWEWWWECPPRRFLLQWDSKWWMCSKHLSLCISQWTPFIVLVKAGSNHVSGRPEWVQGMSAAPRPLGIFFLSSTVSFHHPQKPLGLSLPLSFFQMGSTTCNRVKWKFFKVQTSVELESFISGP